MGTARLQASVEEGLWPLVERLFDAHDVAGLAVAVVRDNEVVMRGFGARDLRSGEPVRPETMFHLASVSKPFVATAVVSLASVRATAEPVLDLDAPIVEWVPELTLADGREGEITARGLLTHSSGLPDVTDYGWHDPQLGDDALSELARSLSGWRLKSEPGSTFSYSNAGFELLGLLLSRVTGTTFENAMRQQVLAPLGMQHSTFLRSEVPAHLASSPHVGMPLTVPEGAYPYTRRHAPSSTLHSNLVELCRWMEALLEPAAAAVEGPDGPPPRLDPELRDLMWRPVLPADEPPWEEADGSRLGRRQLRRTPDAGPQRCGPGVRFAARPGAGAAYRGGRPGQLQHRPDLEHRGGSARPRPATDVRAEEPGDGVAALRALLPSVVGPVAEALTTSGPDAAVATFHRLAAAEPAEFDLDDEGFIDAVWGAIELHRTELVWPLLRVWTGLRPDSSDAWTMSGWAHQVDGRIDLARALLRRALDLDPENDGRRADLERAPTGLRRGSGSATG